MSRKLVPVISLALSLLVACTKSPVNDPSAAQVADGAGAGGDASHCPLQPKTLNTSTPYTTWRLESYQPNSTSGFAGYGADGSAIAVDVCVFSAADAGAAIRDWAEAMTLVATGDKAAVYAKHFHDICSESLDTNARGTVQPLPGVTGGQQCVTAKGSASFRWVEAPGRTVSINVSGEGIKTGWADKALPQLLALAAN